VQSATSKKTSTGIRPAILGYASAMGLYKNGQPNIDAIKEFQRKNGLKDDGIIGPDTSGAILSAAPAGMTGMGRGGQGGPAAYKQNMPPMPAGGGTPPVQGATPAIAGRYPNPVTDPEGYKRAINQGLVKKYSGNEQPAQAATPAETPYRGYKSGQNYVNPAQPQRESSEVARIRHLAGLTRN
jgi:peptidoglycan hydrolase-like protein with peptidoglycan-binding domain